jgi:hypothetical protein
MTTATAAASKYAKTKREPNEREKKIMAKKARKNARHRRNARHG